MFIRSEQESACAEKFEVEIDISFLGQPYFSVEMRAYIRLTKRKLWLFGSRHAHHIS